MCRGCFSERTILKACTHAATWARALKPSLSYVLATGYLVFKSTFTPRPVGVLMAIGGASYVLNSFIWFVLPTFAAQLVPYIQLPWLIGEGSVCLTLLIAGVNVQRWVAMPTPRAG